MPSEQSYGDLIREARDARGWTQGELGERIGEGGPTISNWENERHRPSIEQGNRLILALGLSAEAFWQSMGAHLTAPAATKLPKALLDSLLALTPEELAALTLLAGKAAESRRPRSGSAP